MMKQLELSKGDFDHESEFTVEGVRGHVSLRQGYSKKDDGIYWGLQHGVCIQSSYTSEEVAHFIRMENDKSIQDGEIVLIEDEKYKVTTLGNFSNCVIFEKMEDNKLI